MHLRSANSARPKLPDRVRLLYVTSDDRPGDWLRDLFRHEEAVAVSYDEAPGAARGMARLREDAFDLVIVSHDSPRIDALDFVDALRAADHDVAAIVLGQVPAVDLEAMAFEAGADAYCCITSTSPRALLWVCARALNHRELLVENQRLRASGQQRLASEHNEAQRLLSQQRTLVAELQQLESISHSGLPHLLSPSADGPAPTPLANIRRRYRDLLRAYVVMGIGSLADELTMLVEQLTVANVPAQTMVQIHVDVLEEMLSGIGNRSGRHVMTRADLLLVELMSHLADGYRSRYNQRHDDRPPAPVTLPERPHLRAESCA